MTSQFLSLHANHWAMLLKLYKLKKIYIFQPQYHTFSEKSIEWKTFRRRIRKKRMKRIGKKTHVENNIRFKAATKLLLYVIEMPVYNGNFRGTQEHTYKANKDKPARKLKRERFFFSRKSSTWPCENRACLAAKLYNSEVSTTCLQIYCYFFFHLPLRPIGSRASHPWIFAKREYTDPQTAH